MRTNKRKKAYITLPANLVAVLAESIEAVDNGETLQELIEDLLLGLVVDNGGFFESLADFDPATEKKLAAIRRKHGFIDAEPKTAPVIPFQPSRTLRGQCQPSPLHARVI
jgi:hypothetical protein